MIDQCYVILFYLTFVLTRKSLKSLRFILQMPEMEIYIQDIHQAKMKKKRFLSQRETKKQNRKQRHSGT